MNNPNVKTTASPGRRGRKSEALLLIAKAIPAFETRLMPHFRLNEDAIDWRGIEGQDWSEDERIAIHWMEAIWTEKAPRGGALFTNLWQAEDPVREAVVCALARACYASHVIDEYYRQKAPA